MELFNIRDVPEFSAKKFGSKIALQIKSGYSFSSVTYEQLNNKTAQLAEYLMSNGIKKGDAFAVYGENRPEWAIAYLSIARTGAYIIPIDSMLKEQEIKLILHFIGAKGIIVSPRFNDIIREIKDGLPELRHVISMDEAKHPYELDFNEALEKGRILIEKGSLKHRDVQMDIDDPYVILFTSGTTGQSKGVMLTNRNVSHDIINATKLISFSESDRFISMLPLHHTFEATAGFLVPLYSGCTITYARSLKPVEIIEDIKDSQSTIMLGVPLLFEKIILGIKRAIKASLVKSTVVNSMLAIEKGSKFLLGVKLAGPIFKSLRDQSGLSTINLMISGGSALKPEVAQAFEDFGFTLFQGYGLTETSPIVTINPRNKYKHSSIGVPIEGVEVEIDSPNENGEGEIKVKGPIVMKGYYNNKTATDEVIKDGWFYTGDIGYRDKDGYFYISGRKKAIIVTEAGKNVYPEELEEKLCESNMIEEALVLPVINNQSKREEVGAIIYPNPELIESVLKKNMSEAETEKELRQVIKEVINSVSDEVADYKRIKHFELRYEEFPKTTTKKIKRYLFVNKHING
ncbi:MAG: AMP-binding protein [bacterium]|nr:AMP-binding protein [bacterium]